MSGGRSSGGFDRYSQMSEQAAIIAKKKAEVEAKRIASLAQQGQGSVSNYNQLGQNQNQRSKLTPGKSGKNRWGFKGKRPLSEPEETKPCTTTASVANTFSNDGSFLEQFKRMKQDKNQVKAAEVEVEIEVEKPKIPVVKKEESDPDAWYKSALEKAREIAKSMAIPPQTNQIEIKQEGGPDKIEYGCVQKLEEDSVVPVTKEEPKKEELELAAKASSSTSNLVSSLDHSSAAAAAAVKVELPTVAHELASMVAVMGEHVEVIARARNVGEEALAFLYDTEGDVFKQYRREVDSLRRGMVAESTSRRQDAQEVAESKSGPTRKKSRWGDESDKVNLPIPGVAEGSMMSSMCNNVAGMNNLSGVRRNNPQLIQYAIKVFGTTDLEECQWKQCEDQMKMSLIYNELLVKQKQAEIMTQQGKQKYEYDSDEDTEGGTWEHKKRKLEMQKTLEDANKLTQASKGRHHIGDFLPPEELAKFMAKYKAIKNGEEFVEESDYEEQKLTDENLGFKMLQRMGWAEGAGLGSDGQGITNPIGQGQQSSDKKGLGVVSTTHDLQEEDDEFEAYRKRMMLAYRFRPNPLNNPRRAYY